MGTLAAIGVMVGAAQAVAAASWSPLALFAASEQGVWYDPSDFATMFQDSAGTIPVTATTQPVGKILDKSGRGNHATQATAGNRPVLQQDSAGAYYLDFSGTQHLVTASFAWGSDKASIFSAFNRDTTAGTGDNSPVFSFGGTAAGGFVEEYYGNKILHYRRGSGAFGAVTTATNSNARNVSSTILDLSGTTHPTEQPTFRNYGATVAQGTTYGTANTGTGNFGTYALYIGNFGANYLDGRIYQLIIRAATSLAGEISSAETYLGNKCGTPVIANVYYPSSFSDSRTPTDAGFCYQTSVFAHTDYTTTATTIRITTYNDIHSLFSDSAEVGLFVDGVYHSSLAATAEGNSTHTISLSAGSKTLSIVNGLQSKPSATLFGTYVVRVESDAELTQVNLTPTNRMLVYGDSIASGYGATPCSENGWASIVRQAYSPDSLAVEAWGYRSLYYDANTAGLRAAFVAAIAAYSPSSIWLAIGTNDYGLNKWSAASFGTAYAALLDDLHTALPSATIYCQTPLLRTTETANGSGSTLGDYRTQIGTAVSTRTAYATLVDGTAFMTTASMLDGLHPNTAGHALYGAAVIAALGL